MNRPQAWKLALVAILFLFSGSRMKADGETQPGREPKQPVDEAYTAKMKMLIGTIIW